MDLTDSRPPGWSVADVFQRVAACVDRISWSGYGCIMLHIIYQYKYIRQMTSRTSTQYDSMTRVYHGHFLPNRFFAVLICADTMPKSLSALDWVALPAQAACFHQLCTPCSAHVKNLAPQDTGKSQQKLQLLSAHSPESGVHASVGTGGLVSLLTGEAGMRG